MKKLLCLLFLMTFVLVAASGTVCAQDTYSEVLPLDALPMGDISQFDDMILSPHHPNMVELNTSGVNLRTGAGTEYTSIGLLSDYKIISG